MPFLTTVDPTGKSIFVGGAAEDINNLPDPELLGQSIVEKTLGSRQLREVGGYLVGVGSMQAGSLVFEAITLTAQEYRESVEADGGVIEDIQLVNEAILAVDATAEIVGNIINTFQVGGVNAFQLMYDGLGYFAGGKLSWEYDDIEDEFQVLVDGEIVARTGTLFDLSVEGTLTLLAGAELIGGTTVVDRPEVLFNRDGVFLRQNAGAGILPQLDITAAYIKSGDFGAGFDRGVEITNGTIRLGDFTTPAVTITGFGTNPGITLNETGRVNWNGGFLARAGLTLNYNEYGVDRGSGVNWFNGSTFISAFFTDESEGEVTAQYVVDSETGRHMFGVGSSDPDQRFQVLKELVRVGDSQILNSEELVLRGFTESTSASTGALRSSGGIASALNMWAGKQLNAGETLHLRGVQTFSNTGGTINATVSYVRIDDQVPIGFSYTLPSATGTGKVLIIKDVAGFAGSLPHTINRAGGNTIDDATSISLNTDYGRIILLDGASGRWDVLTKE
jgi:hypothetical protein